MPSVHVENVTHPWEPEVATWLWPFSRASALPATVWKLGSASGNRNRCMPSHQTRSRLIYL